MTSLFMIGSLVVGGVNILLAAALLVMYRGIYARTKAGFTLGLLLFAAAFLTHNVIMVYSLVTMMSSVPAGLDPYLLAIGGFEAIGLGAVLWTATR